MIKKLGIVLALSIVPLALVSAVPAGADVPNPNQSLNCSANGAPGQIHCTATDNGGIARIRLIDKQAGTDVKVIKIACTIPTVKKTDFSYADNGDPHRVQVLDCKGNTSAYNVPPLSGF